jgi:hypothetical protein
VEGGNDRPPGLLRRGVGAAVDADGGEGRIFERGRHVPVTRMAFFKPPATAFLSELKAKDRRSRKEGKYINAVGV